MQPLLGIIADDFTGASDIAGQLANVGARTLLVLDNSAKFDVTNYDAIVIALKSRSLPPAEAVKISLEALKTLQGVGAAHIFFKYCSTFDSTPQGNIGPVIDAFMLALDVETTLVCPAFPANGRTVYQGHLFVWDQLLSDSPLKDHPLNPMRQSNLAALLAPQTARCSALVNLHTLEEGQAVTKRKADLLAEDGAQILIVDCVNDLHLKTIASAFKDLKLVTGGSAIAAPLFQEYQAASPQNPSKPDIEGREKVGATAVIAGSCSARTLEQIAHAPSFMKRFQIDPLEYLNGQDLVAALEQWLQTLNETEIPLIYTSAPPEKVEAAKQQMTGENTAQFIEKLLSTAALHLHSRGFRRFVIAGGETSGAIVSTFNVKTVEVGREIVPGVPVVMTPNDAPLTLVLKSGNFGDADFFNQAYRAVA